jgi:ABC-type amino acid transport substrate-binding protein
MLETPSSRHRRSVRAAVPFGERLVVALLAALLAASIAKLASDVKRASLHAVTTHAAAQSSAAGACDVAARAARRARLAIDASDVPAAAVASATGLRAVGACGDAPSQVAAEGELRSVRAAVEHARGDGAWRADLDIAETLLIECRTTERVNAPAAARCAGREDADVDARAAWDGDE